MQLRRPVVFQRDQTPSAGTRARRAPANSRGSSSRSRDANSRFELGRATRHEPKRHVPWDRWFRGVTALVLLGALAYSGTWFYLGDTIRVRQVAISGVEVVDPYVVSAAADLDARSLVTVDLEAARARIEAMPGIASATVARDWPQGISIVVEEHQGWGYWQAAGRRVMIDASGQPLDLARPPAADAPTIFDIAAPTDLVGTIDSSADLVDTVDGATDLGLNDVPAGLAAGVDVDTDTVQLVARLLADDAFAELNVRPSGYVFRRDRGLTVVVDDAPDAVFGDSTNYAFKVSTWSALLDQLTAEELLVAEIDLRFGRNVVLR